MNKYLLVLFSFILLFGIEFHHASAQQFSNDWINYSRQYYKFKIIEDGIYRIDSITLANAGINLSAIDPRNFQIIGRGDSLYIHVEGEGNGVFNSTDFIEFYAKKNDGWLDTALYNDHSWQANHNYSLFNDTAVYYLTWINSNSLMRMIPETAINFGNYNAASYFIKEARQDYTSTYYGGYFDSNGIYDPEYTEAEGWFDGVIDLGVSKTKILSTGNVYPSGPDAIVNTVIVGANSYNHHIEIKVNGNTVINSIYGSFEVARFNFTVQPAGLITSLPNFKFTSIDDLGNPADRQAISYISIKYPHNFDLGNLTTYKLIVPDATDTSKSFLDISNFNMLSSTARLYDLTNHKRITVVENSGNLKALVPNMGGDKECYLTSDNTITYITDLNPVSSSGYFRDYSDIDPDSAFVIITHKSLLAEANLYANYRSTIAGGSHNTIVADIDELYDQFAYGIIKHPMAIRGFADLILHKWTTPPQHLFLIGKSIWASKCRHVTNYSNNLVPTMGEPPSDNMLTAGLNGTMYEPAIPTGRLAAQTPGDVSDYLNKVDEYENNKYLPQEIHGKEWMKNVLHFGGGANVAQQQQFANYLKQYEDIIEDTLFGGYVYTFLKNTSDPIQMPVAETVRNLINGGVSILTFFGHAWGGGFDQNIDFPENYSNDNGKYPFLIANSCFAGDIHQPGAFSTSEVWVLHERGVIGFIASVSEGETGPLHTYSTNLYNNIGKNFYGQSIGKIIQETIKAIQPSNKITLYGMALHCDPAIILNSHELPDYTITSPDVFFTPETVTAELDSFDINIVITNIGRAVEESFIVEVIRNFPNNLAAPKKYIPMVHNVYYKDTLTITLPVDVVNGIGLNTFDIMVDAGNMIDEMSEINNSLSNIILFIKADNIIPVYPYEYAIIPNNTVTLKASTGDPFAVTKNYIFEIDTTDLFNSPGKKIQTVNQSGGVVNAPMSNWLPNTFTFQDSTVYYWRVSPDTINSNDTANWRESSFQYIDGKTGWGQSHFFQFKNDQYNYIGYNRPLRRFDFITTTKELHCRTVGNASNSFQWSETKYFIDAEVQDYGSYGAYDAILIAVIDSLSLKPWESNIFYYGHANYPNSGYGNDKYFVFYSSPTDSTSRDNMVNMLNSIPNGNYILAYTFIKANTSYWKPSVFEAFEDLGADSSDLWSIPNNFPFIFFTKKGIPGSAILIRGNDPYDTIDLYADLTNNASYGDITSTIVGPAANWGSLHWRINELENNDTVRLMVSGIDLSGNEAVIPGLENILPGSYDINDLSFINASAYPYLNLNLFLMDDTLHTPVQLEKWQVIYDGVPEIALNPSIYYYFYDDTLLEGEMVRFSSVVENISEYDIDSLLISYWIIDNDRNKQGLYYERKKPLVAGDTLLASIEYSTRGLPGINSLWIEVNPKDTLWQLEQYHFNNIAEIPFFVQSDQTNPILDVTFDGIHILDGDIVSAKPEIVIQLNDENKFLALNDTSLFKVYLKIPNSTIDEHIPFVNGSGKEIMRWTPAALPNNSCKIEYIPELKQDGKYELLVQATDISDNNSGDIDYRISFEVINKPTITNVLNWPNPFSTKTHFVFTLTGSEVPQDFRIRIITVTGKVVREIFADELGTLRIGRNITDYAWDGKDQFGDQLANGIYLYKVVVRLNGNDIEKRETNADKYFHKGFGKMYLMR
ncbi:MAG: C25 family cysteine peptidase [Bacteroidota bacterium]